MGDSNRILTTHVGSLVRTENSALKGGAAGMWTEQERFGDFYREYKSHESTLWLPPAPSKPRYHICCGSQNAPHTYDPALIDIVDLILEVNVGACSIETSNVRHEHAWQIWQDVKLPAGRKIAPGVIGHATNVVEHPELIAMRLTNFAGPVGRENVSASTDCGFSQGWNSPRVLRRCT